VTTFKGMFNGATAWQDRYVNCGFDSSNVACSEVSAGHPRYPFVTSGGLNDGPARAWIRADGNCDAAFIVGGSGGACTDALAPVSLFFIFVWAISMTSCFVHRARRASRRATATA